MLKSSRTRASALFFALGSAGLVALAACAAPTDDSEDARIGVARSHLSTAPPSWIVYPGGPENHMRNSLVAAVGTSVHMAPIYGGGKPTSYTLVGLADIYGGSNTLPRGMTFDSATGVISGAPAEPIDTSYFDIYASNELGAITGSDGRPGVQRIRMRVVQSGTAITQGWYLVSFAGFYTTWQEACDDYPARVCAAKAAAGSTNDTCTLLSKKRDWTPWAPSSERASCLAEVISADGSKWPYAGTADLWCNGNATTNSQVNSAGELVIADPSYVAAPPAGDCLCPAGTAWDPMARDGKGNCERHVNCQITTSTCPNFPDYVGTFNDVPDYNTESMDWTYDEAATCARRAKGWYDLCGADAIVRADYTVNEAIKATTYYPNAPPPPPPAPTTDPTPPPPAPTTDPTPPPPAPTTDPTPPPPAPTTDPTPPPPAPTTTAEPPPPPPAPTTDPTPPPPAPTTTAEPPPPPPVPTAVPSDPPPPRHHKPKQICVPDSVTCTPCALNAHGLGCALRCNHAGTHQSLHADTRICAPPPRKGRR